MNERSDSGPHALNFNATEGSSRGSICDLKRLSKQMFADNSMLLTVRPPKNDPRIIAQIPSGTRK